jgi:hypothetical protein
MSRQKQSNEATYPNCTECYRFLNYLEIVRQNSLVDHSLKYSRYFMLAVTD